MSASILIVDPDAKAQSILANGLRKEGYEVVTASTGSEALALLQNRPAMVLADVEVPGTDGFALCQQVKAACGDVPCFLLSRKEAPFHRDLARDTGADDYFLKPLYLKDVCTLTRLFAGKSSTERLVKGDLETTPLFFLLRALTAGGRSGTIQLTGEGATVYFRDGKIVDAVAGRLNGESAMNRLLTLSAGAFTVEFGAIARDDVMSYTVRDLVLHGDERIRRFRQALASVGGLDSKLQIDFAGLARELERMPDSLNTFVRLFDGERTLSDVLREAALDDVTAIEVVSRLVSLGVLETAKSRRAEKIAIPPPLFEPRPDEAMLEMAMLFSDEPPPADASALPQTAPNDVRDWVAEFEPREESFAGVMTPMPEALDATVNGELATPAGASALDIPSWAFAAADEATRAAMLVRSQAPRAVNIPVFRKAQPAQIVHFPAPSDVQLDEDLLDVAGLKKGGKLGIVLGGLAVCAVIAAIWMWAASSATPVEPPAPVETAAAAPAPTPAPEPEAIVVAPTAPAAVMAPVAAAPVQLDPIVLNITAPAAEEPKVAAPVETDIDPTPLIPADPAEMLAKGKKLTDAGKGTEALPLLQKAAAALKTADAQVAVAMAAFDANKLTVAEEAAMKALELDEKSAAAELVLGMVYQQQGSPSKAKVEYEQYLKLAPNGDRAAEVQSIIAGMK